MDFVNSVLAKGEKFTDTDFPPHKSSLCKPDDPDKSDFVSQWRRASEIYEQPEIFKNEVDFKDISQGLIGNCYFLAALSSSAEVPERIGRRFLTQQINECGIYAVTFFINGFETPVIFDDYLPCNEAGESICAKSKDEGELWVPLLEKAWAKLHGSYIRSESGWSSHVSMHLTGLPSQNFKHANVDTEKLWQRML